MTHDLSVIAVTNRKGGTGKTTTAVNLAAQWGMQGYRTLLVDLDTQGHAAIGLGCRDSRKKQGGMHQIFRTSDVSLADFIIPTPVNNVSLASADTDFNLSENAIDTQTLSGIKGINSDFIKQNFDRIVLDTPPTLDGLLINALIAAHAVLVPFIPHHLAEVGVNQLAKLLYQVATRHNSKLKLLALLPVMYDRHIKLHQRVVAELGKQFGKERILRGIRSNIKLAESFEAGQPVNLFSPRCIGAMDYQLMAHDLEMFIKVRGSL